MIYEENGMLVLPLEEAEERIHILQQFHIDRFGVSYSLKIPHGYWA